MVRGFGKVAGMKPQLSFAPSEYAGRKKVTRQERVMPWGRLCGVLDPHYPQGQRGRPSVGLERIAIPP